MNTACSTVGNNEQKVCASITSPASSQMTVCMPMRFNIAQFIAHAVVVRPITSSIWTVREIA